MTIVIEIVCSIDDIECREIEERIKENTMVLSKLVEKPIEVRRLLLPMPREWLSIETPLLIALDLESNERRVIALELNERSIAIDSVDVLISEVQVLSAEAIAL